MLLLFCRYAWLLLLLLAEPSCVAPSLHRPLPQQAAAVLLLPHVASASGFLLMQAPPVAWRPPDDAANAATWLGGGPFGVLRVRLTPSRGSPLFRPSSSMHALHTGCSWAGLNFGVGKRHSAEGSRPEAQGWRMPTAQNLLNLSAHLAGDVAAALAVARLRQHQRLAAAGAAACPRHTELFGGADQVDDCAWPGCLHEWQSVNVKVVRPLLLMAGASPMG